MQTLTDIRIYTGAMRREGDDLTATGVKIVGNEWVYINADDESTNIVRVPVGAVCECEPQPIPEPTPRCDNSGTNVLATLLRGADGNGIIGGYFSNDGSLYLKMSDASEVFAGKIDLSNYYTKNEVDGKRLPNPLGLSYSFNGTSGNYDGSMSKSLPSIYAPLSAGKKGQILSSNGAGEPVWVDAPSLSGAEVKWEDVQNKPTKIKGFGITDAYTKSEVDNNIASLEDYVNDELNKKVGKSDTINANMVSELAYAATGVARTAPIIANRIPQLRADAFAFLQPDEFTVEQAFDGETWETLDSNTTMHRRLFTQENHNTGVEIHSSNGSWAVGSKIRITMYPKNARNVHVDFIAINMYCNGRAFDISGEYCAKNDEAPVWQDMLRTTSINNNGVAYIQYNNKFSYAAYSRWGIRLTFTITKNTAYWSRIQGISGFGNIVSEVSSSVSNAPYTLGTLWHWDYLKNITFPNGITANSLAINGGTSSALLQGDGTPISKTSLNFDVTQSAFTGPNHAWRSNEVWPILASQIDVYRANRLAFLQDDEYEVETSTDGGATWTTTVKDDAMRKVFIGLNNGNISIPSSTTDMMRITIRPNSARYSRIDFFYMWVSCPSEGNTFAKIEFSTGAAPDTWSLHSTAPIAGLSGPNMMKYQRLFGHGSSVANVRFTIYNTVDHTIGTSVYGIQGHGANAWGDINNMYKFGHLYSWDVAQNAKFPAKVAASSFEDSNGNAVMLAKNIPKSLPNPQALEITIDGITKSYNGNEVVRIGVTTPKEADVAGWGFTKNVGTITGIKMNGVSKGASGEVDLGTIITEHQDISGKQDVISDLMVIRSGASKGATAVQPSQLANVATSGSYKDLKDTPTIPSSLSDLNDDSTHRTVTDTEKATWSSKSDFSGSYADLNGKPTFKTINGKSILGVGNITISGGSGASGSAQLPLRTFTENVGRTWEITSGMVTVFTTEQTEGSNFLLRVGEEEAGVDNVWVVRFSIGAANTGTYRVVADTNIKWANGIAPTFENGKYYELSFRLIGQTFLGVWASFE